MSQDRARSFLDDCAEIENVLKSRYNMGRNVRGFGDAIREAETKDAVVRSYFRRLLLFAELRNALSHHAYQGGEPIATPRESTVLEISRIRAELVEPTKVESKVKKDSVFVVEAGDPLRPCLLEMWDRSYSQAPVFDAGRYVGALTTNAVARWVASNMDPQTGELLLEGSTVGDVLSFVEPHERFDFVPRKMTVAAAVEVLLSVTPPLGLIVTQTGKKNESPLGILVTGDLPELGASLDVR